MKKRIGSGTLAIGLISLGVLLLLQVSGVVTFQVFKYFGPALIILFGLEIIWSYMRQSDSSERNMRFSAGGIILVVIVVAYSVVESIFPHSISLQPKFLSPVSEQIQISSDITRVDIQIPDGKVNIVGVSGQQVSYSGELESSAGSQEEADQKIEDHWKVRQVGDTLEIILDLPYQFSLFDFSFNSSGYLDVELPQALITHVKTRNSNIHIEQMNADVTLDTSNGKMTAEDIQGNLEVDTSNGSITVSRLEGNLQAKTSNGKINLTDIAGTVTAKSSNGTLNASSAISGTWDLKTSNGKINLKVPENTDATIKANTSNGSFNGDVPWVGNERNDRSSTLGDGTHTVILDTSNGSITVDYR